MDNKQFLIEIAVGDAKLKSSLKKALTDPGVQKQLGILGEGITEHLEKDVGKAASILGKVNWAELLGEKDFEHLQQVVANTIKAEKHMIQAFAKKGDLKGIQDTIAFVSELGAELRSIDPDRTVADLVRSMGSLMRVIEPLSGKFEELANAPEKLAGAFGNMANGAEKSLDRMSNRVSRALDKMYAEALEPLNKQLKAQGESIIKYQIDDKELTAFLDEFKDADAIIKALNKELENSDAALRRLKNKDTRDASSLINLVQHEQKITALMEKLEVIKPSIDSGSVTKDIDATIEQIAGKLEKGINKTFKDSFTKVIEEKLSTIRVNIDVPNEEELISQINDVIAKVNEKGTNSFKLVGAESAINAAQKQILDNTKQWHEDMKKYLKFDKKEDITLDLGAKMREIGSNVGEQMRTSIEEYFSDPKNKVAVPVELVMSGGNKATIDGGNVTINGTVGGGGITAEDLVKAFTTPIDVKVQEDQKRDVPASTKLFDYNSDFANNVLSVFDELFRIIDNGGENAKKIIGFFNMKGINLPQLKGNPMDILNAYETFLNRGDQSVLDDVNNKLIKGTTKNKATLAFADLLRDSVLRFDLKNIDVGTDIKREQVRELIEKTFIPQSIARDSLNEIMYTKSSDYEIPTVEELDKLMADLPEVWGTLGEDFLPALESLKDLRSKITDPTNAQEIQRFKDAADEFATNVKDFYSEMQSELGFYKIGVFYKGRNKNKKTPDLNRHGSNRGFGEYLKENLDKIDYFELYSDQSGQQSRSSRQDAMDRMSRRERYQIRASASDASYRSKEQKPQDQTKKIEISKFEPKERQDAELKEIEAAKNSAKRRTEKIEEARRAAEAEEKAAEELRKQQLAADKKRRTALKSQRTKNENKLNGLTDTAEIAELTDKNKELSAEITELDNKINKNDIEPSKNPTIKQQLDAMPKVKDIQEMIDNVNAIDAKVAEAQKKADEFDERINKKLKAEKVPKLGYTQAEKNNSSKFDTASTKSATLDMVLSDKTATRSSFAGLSKKEADAVKKLLTDRKLGQLINGKDGLGLPQNSNLEDYAKSRIQSYQNGLNKIDEFLLKYQDQTIQYVEDDSDLSEFLKDQNVTRMMAGNFNGSQEEANAVRAKIEEFRARMTEVGKNYIVDYLDMWSDSNLRSLMKDNKTRNATSAQGDTVLQEFYRRIVEGGVGKRGEAYRYLKGESAKYQKAIAKDESAVDKLLVSAQDQLATTQAKEIVAADRLKAEYKNYVSQWLQTIQQNMADISSDAFSAEEKALKIKKNEELRGLINQFARDYFESFKESLLDETQRALLNKRESVGYVDLRDNQVSAIKSEQAQKQSEIDAIIAQKSELLRQRRFDLLKQIGSRAKKGDDTASLEKALLEVEDELVKYSDKLPQLLRDEFEEDLLNAKNATEEKWKQFAAKRLKAKKDNALARKDSNDEKLKSIIGESATRSIVMALPSDASLELIEAYNREVERLIELDNKRSQMKTSGQRTDEIDREIANKTTQVINSIKARVNDEKQRNDSYDPKVQASNFIEQTNQAAYDLKQRADQAERDLEKAQRDYAAMNGDEYKNSGVYRDKIKSLKQQAVAEYVRSDNYKIARQKGEDKVNEELFKYLFDELRNAEENKNLSDEDYAKKIAGIVHEFSYNKDRANVESVIRTEEEAAELEKKRLEELDAKRKQLEAELSANAGDAIKTKTIQKQLQNLDDEIENGKIVGGVGSGARLAANALGEEFATKRQEYVDSDAYKQLVADAKANREKEIEAKLAADKQETESKVQEIWNSTKENIKKLRKSTLENSEELRAAVEAQAQADGMGDSAEYKNAIVDQVRENLIQETIESGKAEQRLVNSQYFDKARELRAKLSPDMYKQLNEKADQVAHDAVMGKLRGLIGDNKSLMSGLDEKRKNLMETYVGNIVAEFEDGLRFEETNIYKGENIRDLATKEAKNRVAYAERRYMDASGQLGMLEYERSRAKSYGELGYDESLNPEVAKVRAETEARLTAEKAKQVALTEKLTTLTAQNADKNVVQSVAAELAATEKAIGRLQMRVEGADHALDMRKNVREEELASNAFTPDKVRLWLIDHIEEAKKILGSGTDAEKTKASENIARWEQKLADVEKVIEAAKPEAEKPKTVLDMITSAIRQGLANVTAGGTVDLDASLYNIATETTLQEILRLLGGNGAVEYANQLKKELAKDRPHYERKDSDSGNTSNRSGGSRRNNSRTPNGYDKLTEEGQRIHSELDAASGLFIKQLKNNKRQYEKNFNFVDAINKQLDVVKKLEDEKKQGTVDYIKEQTKLTVLYQDYYNKTFNGKKNKPKQAELAKNIDGLQDRILFKSNRAAALAGIGYGVAKENDDQSKPDTKPAKKTTKKTKTETKTQEVDESTQKITDVLSKLLESKEIRDKAETDGIELSEAKLKEILGIIVSAIKGEDGLGRDEPSEQELLMQAQSEGKYIWGKDTSEKNADSDTKTRSDIKDSVKDGVKAGVAESSSVAKSSDDKIPYEVDPNSLIGKLQNVAGGDTGALAKQATLALVLSELQAINKKIATTGKAGVKSSAQNLLEEFQKMAMGSAMDAKERVSNFDLVNGAMSPALSGAAHSISQKLLDTLSEQYGVGQGYRSQVHTHADSDQTWFSAKDLEHFKKNLGDFGADSIKQQVLLTKDNITVFDMTMVETAENAALAIDILKKAGSNVDNESLEKLTELGARYQSKDLGSIGAKGLMDLLGVQNYKNDGKNKDAEKSTKSETDAVAKKLHQYRAEIQNAKNELLLADGEDSAFVAAEKEVNKLVEKIDSGKLNGQALSDAIEELGVARQKVEAESKRLRKVVSQRERLRGGTLEVKQAITQGTRVRSVVDGVVGTDDDDAELLQLKNQDYQFLQNYIEAYNDLITKQREYIKDGSINSTKVQDSLKVQTAGVKKLGIEAMAAYKNTKELEEASAHWEQQTYTDKAGNVHALGGSTAATGIDREAMLKYAKDVLGANLESVKLNQTTGKLTGVLRKNNYVVADMAVQYDKGTGKMHLFQEKERESLSGIPGFLRGLEAKRTAIMQYLISMTSIYRVFGELRKGIQYVREIDKALTELKKVTDETEEAYDKFLKTAAKTGERLGSTISAVTEATATFAKLGYSMQQASEMAEAAIVYKNVGDNIASTEDAADSIISTMKGFRLEASESMAIVDRFNEVGNRFAITSQGIGEALRLSASALSEGGNSLDESIGLITAANEVVNDPSSVGKK